MRYGSCQINTSNNLPQKINILSIGETNIKNIDDINISKDLKEFYYTYELNPLLKYLAPNVFTLQIYTKKNITIFTNFLKR